MANEELTALEWQFQLYLSGLPIQDKATFKSRSTLANFSIPELAGAFKETRLLLNLAWANQAHRIKAPEGDVGVHLDFIESPIVNAITFGSDGAYFVGITEPFLALTAESSGTLWRADFLAELIAIEMTKDARDFLFQVLMLFQFQFIADHELGHLFHGHQRSAFRAEFVSGVAPTGNTQMRKQAGELEADGYAVSLLLNGMLRSSSGSQIHARLGSTLEMEDCILTLFLLSVGALFYFMEPAAFNPTEIRRDDHPFALARMNIVMDEITSWCTQHLPTYADWASLNRFQWIMACVGAVKDSPDRTQMWKDQGTFLLQPEGKEYLTDLLTEKLALRSSMDGSRWTLE